MQTVHAEVHAPLVTSKPYDQEYAVLNFGRPVVTHLNIPTVSKCTVKFKQPSIVPMSQSQTSQISHNFENTILVKYLLVQPFLNLMKLPIPMFVMIH